MGRPSRRRKLLLKRQKYDLTVVQNPEPCPPSWEIPGDVQISWVRQEGYFSPILVDDNFQIKSEDDPLFELEDGVRITDKKNSNKRNSGQQKRIASSSRCTRSNARLIPPLRRPVQVSDDEQQPTEEVPAASSEDLSLSAIKSWAEVKLEPDEDDTNDNNNAGPAARTDSTTVAIDTDVHDPAKDDLTDSKLELGDYIIVASRNPQTETETLNSPVQFDDRPASPCVNIIRPIPKRPAKQNAASVLVTDKHPDRCWMSMCYHCWKLQNPNAAYPLQLYVTDRGSNGANQHCQF